MKIISTCKSCKSPTKLKTGATNRPDLIKEQGEEININCSNCGNNQKHHVNDFQAVANPTFAIIAAIISLILSVVLWNSVGIIGTASIIIPLLIWKQQMSTTAIFNNYRTRRKPN
jgi:hypothetical protein